MSILKLKPAYKSAIWGGNRLKTEYHKDYPGASLAETWELSCHADGPSVIAEGPCKGMTLPQYIESNGRRVLGSNCQIYQDFPILIKLIDAKDNLSIQVHPNNMDALEKEHQYGKTEMWYVLEADPGAFLYYGFKREISRQEYCARIADGSLEAVLNAVPVKKGDLFYIPAGTVHAIGKGMVIAEIQQNSNVTYRVYDYGRIGKDGVKRALHVEQAVKVSKLEHPFTGYNFGGHLLRCAYFTVDEITSPCTVNTDEESFTSLLVIEGGGEISTDTQTLTLQKGDSILITAASGMSRLSGDFSALCTRIGTI